MATEYFDVVFEDERQTKIKTQYRSVITQKSVTTLKIILVITGIGLRS
jgi:hypothetical protein